MTNESLATYANYALASAALVLTLAMLGFALYLARAVPVREEAAARTADRVGARSGAGRGGVDLADRDADGEGSSGAATRADAASAADEPEQTSLRGRQAAGIAGSLTWLGTGLLLLSSVLRGLAVERFPLGNLFEFSVVGCLFAVATFSAVSLRRDVRWLGLFVTGFVVLVLMVAQTAWYVPADELVPSLKSYWLPIHVTVATLAVGICVVAAIVSALYLLSDRQAVSPRFWAKLPPAPQLEKLSYALHIIAFPLWTFTIIAGAIWAHEAWGAYWNWDPKEVWSFVIWVVYAAYLHARATKNTSRRTANWIALAGFACIVINYTVVNFYFIGQHSYAQ
ncbi:c-type cytochrome biogenesis protein CcsB [Janibacter alkaliphilus]|uniref:Cytochrome c-type biogenesis protein CcsB n=1 Tax=Janibacter alkaliphilus TaxID=1069963 RepID=A0A852X1U8_9MICO|nr:c-type cytochrome biogenesis protein CcsB [Janibacter alkaliphilus]NYG37066.1 cytochrome c-type biogenesis protein CcsB [Janibacter alkaliphilus]